YKNVCITDEFMTSQACLCCFSKLNHLYTKKDGKRKSKGSLLCGNPKCVIVKNNKALISRDPLSALAIVISGLYKLFLYSRLASVTSILILFLLSLC
ncbi:hypothetical protein BCV72DRAFT_313000, partial [Rhizopus microsporus var. microsporus]